MEGGTYVTIEGSDLGLKEEDVRGKIHIGTVPCELVKYQVNHAIILLAGSTLSSSLRKGMVCITLYLILYRSLSESFAEPDLLTERWTVRSKWEMLWVIPIPRFILATKYVIQFLMRTSDRCNNLECYN